MVTPQRSQSGMTSWGTTHTHTHTHTLSHTHEGFPILGSSVSEDTLSSVRRELLPVFFPWV